MNNKNKKSISLKVYLWMYFGIFAVVIMLVGFKWNIYSLVVGNIVFSLCMCILNGRALKRFANYRQEIKKTFLLPFAAAITMGIGLYVAYISMALILPKKLATVLAITIAGCVYVVCLLKFGALTPNEIVALPKGNMLLRIFQRMRLVRTEIE